MNTTLIITIAGIICFVSAAAAFVLTTPLKELEGFTISENGQIKYFYFFHTGKTNQNAINYLKKQNAEFFPTGYCDKLIRNPKNLVRCLTNQIEKRELIESEKRIVKECDYC